MNDSLTGPERALLNWVVQLIASQNDKNRNVKDLAFEANLAHVRLNMSKGLPGQTVEQRKFQLLGLSSGVLILMGIFMVNRVVCALIFRGGLSWLLAGVTLVQSNGQPCGRFRCAVRSVVVWLPLMLLCLLLLFVQSEFPKWVAVRVVLTFALLALLMSYVVIAIRYPSRPPQDRLMGTHIVPM